MTEMTRHEPGMLCWADLATTDAEGAKRFYGELFGWALRDDPIPDDGVYTMALVRGRTVAAMSAMQPEMRAGGVPAHWNAYVSVADVEAVAAKVAPAGGKIVAEPFDVMGQGRMAVLADPTGAMLSLWQPQKHPGAGLMNEPSALCWAELMTRDTRKAGEFYARVLGWNRQEMPEMKYTVFAVGQAPAVGMMAMPAEAGPAPSSWMVYFDVVDCEATRAKTERLGGRAITPTKEASGVGRFAVLQDPQGAVFGVLQPSSR